MKLGEFREMMCCFTDEAEIVFETTLRDGQKKHSDVVGFRAAELGTFILECATINPVSPSSITQDEK
jgi:hypothetical protein